MPSVGKKIQQNECSICLSQHIPETRSTRRSKSVDWICCDCCKSWFHAICGGYSAAEYSKVKQANSWIKCIVCCLRSVQAGVAGPSFGHILQAVEREGSSSRASRRKSGKDTTTDCKEDDCTDCSSAEVLTDSVAAPSKPVDSGSRVAATSCNSEIDNILVIDNIDDPTRFSSSRSILKEVNILSRY